MAVTFDWVQSNGAGNTLTVLGDVGHLTDFRSVDTAGITSGDSIQASDTVGEGYSFENWKRCKFTGTGDVSNIKFWENTAFVPDPANGANPDGYTAPEVLWGVTDTYATPVDTESAIATNALPSSTPGSANVSIGGSMGGTLTLSASSGYSDYIVEQSHSPSTVKPGGSSSRVVAVEYDVV